MKINAPYLASAIILFNIAYSIANGYAQTLIKFRGVSNEIALFALCLCAGVILLVGSFTKRKN